MPHERMGSAVLEPANCHSCAGDCEQHPWGLDMLVHSWIAGRNEGMLPHIKRVILEETCLRGAKQV